MPGRYDDYTMNTGTTHILTDGAIEEIVAENRRRCLLRDVYDPIAGVGCVGNRCEVVVAGVGKVCVPEAMLSDLRYSDGMPLHDFEMLRMEHDFEFWCAKCAMVKNKSGGNDFRLRLNRPQRLILAELERMRTAGKPIRAIVLKARQCGISTLIQLYMAWIQLLLRDNWHSLVCAHLRDAASTIKGMMTKLLAYYPEEYLPEGVKRLQFRPFEGSRSVSRIDGRQNTVAVCSAESRESARGSDIAMAHLSEVAFWRQTPAHDPNDIIRSVAGTIALAPLTLIVMESTANGVGNFFHDEWLRAKGGISDKCPIFVPWYDYGIYRVEVDDPAALWGELDDYERRLWDVGLSLEQIAWYHEKRREYSSHKAMQAEYPTTDAEAFTSTDRTVFDPEGVEKLRKGCREPMAVGDMVADAPTGSDALRGVRFAESQGGLLKVWKMPANRPVRYNRYIAVVDIGGRSDSSDFSVISVIDRGDESGSRPEIVAQWRGHTDHDLLAWKAAQIALWYRKALLVIESNTLETAMTEGDNSGFILEEIADYYPNMYHRQVYDRATGNCSSRIGFHTNRNTKPLIVNRHIATVRDGGYTEHDSEAVNEHATYERKPNGSYGAKEGSRDDILMTRCIGLFVASELTREDQAATDITPLKHRRNRSP